MVTFEQYYLLTEDTHPYISISMAAALLAIAGLYGADKQSLRKQLSSELQKYPMNSKDATKNALKAISRSKNTPKNEYSDLQIVNILAHTLFREARGEPEATKRAVMNVIWNRANGKKENFVNVVFRRKQFSCWNKAHPETNFEYSPEQYQISAPKELMSHGKIIASEQRSWDLCKQIANEAVSGKFKPKYKTLNSFINKDIGSHPSWEDQCNLKIGNLWFGTVKNQIPRKVYIVKKGDTLSKIAKIHNLSISHLIAKNPKIKNLNKIYPNQKIFL